VVNPALQPAARRALATIRYTGVSVLARPRHAEAIDALSGRSALRRSTPGIAEPEFGAARVPTSQPAALPVARSGTPQSRAPGLSVSQTRTGQPSCSSDWPLA
jgi:hypothetical protein